MQHRNELAKEAPISRKSVSGMKKKVVKEDFETLGHLGKGSYGEVMLVRKKENGKQYAMKCIDKHFLFKVQ